MGFTNRLTNRTEEKLEATTGAIAWTINPNADFNVTRITLNFSIAPTTADYVTVTVKSKWGTAYDQIVCDNIKPMTYTTVSINNILGMEQGDSVLVEYTNTDANSITGICSYVM
jgi:hypothetical protein